MGGNKMSNNKSRQGYLALTMHPDSIIIVYKKNKHGEPILNEDDILIIKEIKIFTTQ
jgi:hypothetical protein